MLLTLSSLTQTQYVAEYLADHISPSDVLCFYGRVGAGKTTFISYFLRYLMRKNNLPEVEITSPTFALIQEYDIKGFQVAHFDLYRLEDEFELEQIGCDDFFEEQLCLVEWPERAEEIIPKKRLNLYFDVQDDCRSLTLAPAGGYSLGKIDLKEISVKIEGKNV